MAMHCTVLSHDTTFRAIDNYLILTHLSYTEFNI